MRAARTAQQQRARDGLRAAFREAICYATTRNELEGWPMQVVMRRGGGFPTAIAIHGAPGSGAVRERMEREGFRFRVLRTIKR